MARRPEPNDPRIWRAWFAEPVLGESSGPLAALTVAVKDVFAVAGYKTGFGNPAFLNDAPVNADHAQVVRQLLSAGASLRGISHLDEFAYSLDGTNPHYGTPPNPLGDELISGGSSSGSASAVAWGFADIGLGTDTGGSIRIPAAYQGLYGLRPTHGVVSVDGVTPMAVSFDAVGWMTRSAELLARVGEVLLPAAPSRGFSDVVVVSDLLNLAVPEVREPVRAFAQHLGAHESGWPGISLEDLSDFVTLQASEVWQAQGAWVSKHLDSIGPGVHERFEMAALFGDADAQAARANVIELKERLIDWLGDRVLVLPTAPMLTPRYDEDLAAVRGQIQRLSCVSGIAGAPALTIPLPTESGLPVGACLMAAPGRDRDLLEYAQELSSAAL